MVTNRLWSAPKALVWKHPRDTNIDLFQFISFLWLASWFLICILIAKCLNEIGQPYGLYSKTGEVYNLRRVMKEREESGTAMRGSLFMKEWEVHLSIVCLFKLIDFTKVKSQQWLLTETTCSAANLLFLSVSISQMTGQSPTYCTNWTSHLLMMHSNIYMYTTIIVKDDPPSIQCVV